MGHSSLKVSLTYLRGLEVEDLKEEDMPTFLEYCKSFCQQYHQLLNYSVFEIF